MDGSARTRRKKKANLFGHPRKSLSPACRTWVLGSWDEEAFLGGAAGEVSRRSLSVRKKGVLGGGEVLFF